MNISTAILIFLAQLQLIFLQVIQANSCCSSTVLHFHLKPTNKKSCSDYPQGARVHFSKTFCFTKLCGSFKKPTPCCGVHSCNIFCCNCNCWDRNYRVLVDFRTRYWDEIYNVYQRGHTRSPEDANLNYAELSNITDIN
ncbi:uncharacterized protein LOC117781092 [Drosophila innubila]|uniref:uncharacterized protein LOC117781092 n=1 Tax=Drosophila innubila TaxID=198719 RepID=UPI00148DEFBD|nr:uncharacterized protein LOC117781092 [Drosophila innubila]